MTSTAVSTRAPGTPVFKVSMLARLIAAFSGTVGFTIKVVLLALLMCLVLFLLDILMVYAAIRLFQRETILTRWK